MNRRSYYKSIVFDLTVLFVDGEGTTGSCLKHY